MITIDSLVNGSESLNVKFEDGDEGSTEVSIEQQIEIETGAAETVGGTEEAEVVEEVTETEETAETAEQLMAVFDRLDHAQAVVSTYGWSRSVAAALDYNGEFSKLLGTRVPALESLDMTSSPNDSVSVIALEGIKEAAKSFWEWIKKVCRTIRDQVVNLASRVIGFFQKNDAYSKRLATAISKADISEAKLKDHKTKLIRATNLINRINIYASTVKSAVDGAKAMLTKDNVSQKDVDDTTAALDKAREDSKESKSVKDDREEGTVASLGWNKAIASNNHPVVTLYTGIKTANTLVDLIKKASQALESEAARMEKVTTTDAAGETKLKEAKESAKNKVKAITAGNKILSIISKEGLKYVAEFIRGQRAVFACRGKYDEPESKAA